MIFDVEIDLKKWPAGQPTISAQVEIFWFCYIKSNKFKNKKMLLRIMFLLTQHPSFFSKNGGKNCSLTFLHYFSPLFGPSSRLTPWSILKVTILLIIWLSAVFSFPCFADSTFCLHRQQECTDDIWRRHKNLFCDTASTQLHTRACLSMHWPCRPIIGRELGLKKSATSQEITCNLV